MSAYGGDIGLDFNDYPYSESNKAVKNFEFAVVIIALVLVIFHVFQQSSLTSGLLNAVKLGKESLVVRRIR